MFKTKRLTLNELTLDDVVPLCAIATRINKKAATDSAYHPYYAFQETNDGIPTNQKVANFLNKALKEQNETPRKTFRYAIRKDNILIGSVAIDMIPSHQNGKAVFGDLGYFIDPKHGNKGYGYEACLPVLHQFFGEYKHLDVTAHPDNNYSVQLIKKLGGKASSYCTHSGYNKEPRQAFVVSRSDFVSRVFKEKHLLLTTGKEYV